jgi:BirA family biotin operon repressor/biotin-[acetyl-CoA-carboxylase] ligase
LVSVLLRPDLPAHQRHLVTAAVALAAADAVRDRTELRLDIKWPNDLLAVDGRKVAGVLAEGDLTGTAGGPGSKRPVNPAIVVGLGVNVNWPATDSDLPTELVGSATSLRQLGGHPVDPSELLISLLKTLEPRLNSLAAPSGRSRQTDELRDRCVTLGAPVRVELADSTFEGRAVDLTPEGHLLVETDNGTRTVVAGDVVHVRSQPQR